MAVTGQHQIDRDVPDYMKQAAEDYINHGDVPGGFLKKLLMNDLAGAIAAADQQNRQAIQSWVFWLTNDIPSAAWGDRESLEAWVGHDGLDGW